MKLIGDSITAKLDDKGRMVVPSVFKKRLLSESVTSFVLKKDNEDACLLLYPKFVWDEKDKFLSERLNDFNPSHQRFKREYYRNTSEIEMDGNGRLNLPSRLLEMVGIDKEILVKGGGVVLEFWKPDAYESTALSPEEFSKLGQEIFGSDPLL